MSACAEMETKIRNRQHQQQSDEEPVAVMAALERHPQRPRHCRQEYQSTAAASQPGPLMSNARAASHKPASAASRPCAGVGSPVQLRAAVKRKPVMTATANPNTISWACHTTPLIVTGPRQDAEVFGGPQAAQPARRARPPEIKRPKAQVEQGGAVPAQRGLSRVSATIDSWSQHKAYIAPSPLRERVGVRGTSDKQRAVTL